MPPDGAGDTVARLLSEKQGERFSQPVVIETRPIPVAAVSTVARARPDGDMRVKARSGTAIATALFATLPCDPMTDLVHVSTLASLLREDIAKWRAVIDKAGIPRQ